MNFIKSGKSRATAIVLASFILIFLSAVLYVRFGVLGPLRSSFAANDKTIQELKEVQEGQAKLLEKINVYRDGLYALNLVLEARKQVSSGSDPNNPYLIFDFTQVLNDLRQLLPRDSRVTKFQVNNKGLVTLPIESVDYASLGRVLKSFKDKSHNLEDDDDNAADPKIFKEVKIPAGAQRTIQKNRVGWREVVENVYSFVLQAELNPDFWMNPMPYPDVDPNAYYAEAIRDLTIAGTIEGYADGYFRPMQAINNVEFYKVALFEFLSNDAITIDEYKEFVNLSDSDWYYKYIQLASKMGVVEADEVGRFHPDQTVTRIEALRTILKIYGVETEKSDPESGEESESGKENAQQKAFVTLPFTDIARDDRNFPVILAAHQHGLLENMGQMLQPQLPVTRFEIAYWVWKLKFDYL